MYIRTTQINKMKSKPQFIGGVLNLTNYQEQCIEHLITLKCWSPCLVKKCKLGRRSSFKPIIKFLTGCGFTYAQIDGITAEIQHFVLRETIPFVKDLSWKPLKKMCPACRTMYHGDSLRVRCDCTCYLVRVVTDLAQNILRQIRWEYIEKIPTTGKALKTLAQVRDWIVKDLSWKLKSQ